MKGDWYRSRPNKPINSTDPTGLVAYGPNGPYNTDEEKGNYNPEWNTTYGPKEKPKDDTTTPTNPQIPLPKFLINLFTSSGITKDTDSAFYLFSAERIREILATKYFINDKSGNLIKLYAIDKYNPVLKDLMKQTDERLSSIPDIGKWGCYFMSVLGYAQMTVGKTLTAEQIISIYNKAAKDPNVLGKEADVVNPDIIANMALSELGRSDIGLAFGWMPGGAAKNTAIGVSTRVPYPKTGHYLARDLFGNTIYNSGQKDGIAEREDTVYVHAK